MNSPGHTATPNPRQGERQRDASRHKLSPSMGDLCPDELAAYKAIRESGSYVTPSRVRAMYRAALASANADHDFGAHVLTYLTKHGSRPVDLAVGERVTARMIRASA